MSTRSQVIIQDDPKYQVFLYRHSDGYPSCTGVDLVQFLKRIVAGELRNNASQSSGHLVLQGHKEYANQGLSAGYNWKVGAYEPCGAKLHADIEWLYVIDFETNTFKVYQPSFDFGDKPKTNAARIKASKLVYETAITAEGLIDAQLKLKDLE